MPFQQIIRLSVGLLGFGVGGSGSTFGSCKTKREQAKEQAAIQAIPQRGNETFRRVAWFAREERLFQFERCTIVRLCSGSVRRSADAALFG
ncbi:hypothetical protein ACPOL_5039 [Acidisarcina polymorpha]|uniref:Uncharacterized protein n=1 Tax=Acidisarcina polymorpha TaxID=2211140 RepID=A0A2Z5G683_9BACT|nr:hypothetical protein ACPOL_5039 [Acidisarcina polymorpha]